MDWDHPTRFEGVVSKQIWFPKSGGNIQWESAYQFIDIQVLNCGDFYIYELPEPIIDEHSTTTDGKGIFPVQIPFAGYCTTDK